METQNIIPEYTEVMPDPESIMAMDTAEFGDDRFIADSYFAKLGYQVSLPSEEDGNAMARFYESGLRRESADEDQFGADEDSSLDDLLI